MNGETVRALLLEPASQLRTQRDSHFYDYYSHLNWKHFCESFDCYLNHYSGIGNDAKMWENFPKKGSDHTFYVIFI